jgi:FkbM family methyltransferase
MWRMNMQSYGSNKIRTLIQMVHRIHNWPTAVAMRLFRDRGAGLRLLAFRDGLNVVLRAGTRDWEVLHEIVFAGSYGRAFEFISGLPEGASVLDLGGNIGLFSLACAQRAPGVRLFTYEPGPPNFRLFEMNCLANPGPGERIELRREAVGGTAREDDWFFDEANPGGSSLFGQQGKPCRVKIAAFAEVIASLPRPIALVKIDVEGAEYEILEQTPPETWREIPAVSLELHDNPRGKLTKTAFLDRMRALGFVVEEESVCTFFLHRRPQ